MSNGIPGFRCTLKQDGDVARVLPAGELDIATVGLVEDRIEEALTGGARRLVLDLSELTFMASTGLRLVLQLADKAQAGAFELGVVRGPAEVQRVFELTRTHERVPWVEG